MTFDLDFSHCATSKLCLREAAKATGSEIVVILQKELSSAVLRLKVIVRSGIIGHVCSTVSHENLPLTVSADIQPH